jgi:hypothetical protein
MDQLDAIFISYGDFHAGASGRFAIVALIIMILIGWLAPTLLRRRQRNRRNTPPHSA